MVDSIDRHEAIEAIVTELIKYPIGLTKAYDIAENALNKVKPTTEIIRCRDCKYSQMTDDGECRYCKIWFAEEEHFLPGDYFCADAERREECTP